MSVLYCVLFSLDYVCFVIGFAYLSIDVLNDKRNKSINHNNKPYQISEHENHKIWGICHLNSKPTKQKTEKKTFKTVAMDGLEQTLCCPIIPYRLFVSHIDVTPHTLLFILRGQ